MSPVAPTWGDVEAFLGADGWTQSANRGGKRQRHVFYEKLTSDGRLLQTHVSHAGQKTISPGRFSAILRNQLEVSKDEFWECVRTGRPVDRPAPLDDGPVEHDAWVVRVLVGELHLTADEIEALTSDEAQQMVRDYWSRPT